TPAIDLAQRVAARVYLRVPGDLSPGLVISSIRPQWKPDGPYGKGSLKVTYTLENVGNVRVGVEPSVRYSGVLNLFSRSVEGDKIADLLPGASVTQTVTLDGAWAFGFNTVRVAAKAVAATGSDDPGIGTVRASRTFWTFAWVLVVALVVLVGLIALGVRQLVRARRWRQWGQALAAEQAAGRRPPDTEPAPAVHQDSAR
ncbi:MAG TPA: hypothetical protein VHA75_19155, partial [Rugosimonospora sp.]|nr:hypothetical protein [Rugosimonospora sp.]